VLRHVGCYSPSDAGACRIGTALIPFHTGHLAVVLFFVLSGYVITYVASERETDLLDYSISRFARIYSVAVPAIFITAIIDIFLDSRGVSEGIPLYQLRHAWKYLPFFLSFATNFWFLNESTFSNPVFWSLSYEVWYYVLFGVVFYFAGRTRVLLTVAVLLLIGPPLWILLPIWGMGSFIYRLHSRMTLPTLWMRPLFLLTLAAIALLSFFDSTTAIDKFVNALSGGWISHHLGYSESFAGDFLVGILFAGNIFAAKFVRLEFGPAALPIAFLASLSFTLYLLHWPLLQLWVDYLRWPAISAAAATLALVALIGLVTEWQNRRLRKLLHKFIRQAGRCSP
jgi:peptidoglycan/LPS O-acetylase OafA/YrhL